MESTAIALFKSLELCNAFRAMGQIRPDALNSALVRQAVLDAISSGTVAWKGISYGLSEEEHSFIIESNRLFKNAQRSMDFKEMQLLSNKIITANFKQINEFLSSTSLFSFDVSPILNYISKI